MMIFKIISSGKGTRHYYCMLTKSKSMPSAYSSKNQQASVRKILQYGEPVIVICDIPEYKC